jgi:bifunctional DNA-binding transcriptional regulator/antitoxin component of YhaV-PrlF toxin-antitoxin module
MAARQITLNSNSNNRKGKLPEFTTASKAHSKYNVLRTSIPLGIRSLIDIREGDKLKWDIVTINGKIVVTFEKVKEKDKRGQGSRRQKGRNMI